MKPKEELRAFAVKTERKEFDLDELMRLSKKIRKASGREPSDNWTDLPHFNLTFMDYMGTPPPHYDPEKEGCVEIWEKKRLSFIEKLKLKVRHK